MKVIGVIPARWASTRLEGKVLAQINGKPMIQHVWERAKQSRLLEEVFVACDDERIFDAVQEFGAKVVMTSKEAASGTDRIAKAFKHAAADIIINIQGDEPLIEPALIDSLAHALIEDKTCSVATAAKLIKNEADVRNPNVVKVVFDAKQSALYFSRSVIPFNRDEKSFEDIDYYKHIGIYAYRKNFLVGFNDLPESSLEKTEKLEQLRVLEAGYRIRVVETDYDSVGVDTPEDFDRVKELMQSEESNG